jgi:hypothetical protein
MSLHSASAGGVGEWSHMPCSRRTTVIRVVNGRWKPRQDIQITGPSTIHRSSATGFSVLIGWYGSRQAMARLFAADAAASRARSARAGALERRT